MHTTQEIAEAVPGRRLGRRFRRGSMIMMGVGAFGVAGASAASLGGLTAQQIGADNGAVASCDTDGVTLAYTSAYDATTGVYRITTVTVSGLNVACNAKTLNVTLTDASNASIGTGSATIASTSQAVTMSPTASAKLVVGAALLVTG
ncbi:MAG: hypothetical protein JWN62_1699 [Acidimicrobiales bacterium]|nr:hypothetical protein [Acidimicrobiales bacterium]